MAFSFSVPLPFTTCPKGIFGSSSSSNNYSMLGKWSARRYCCASLFNRRSLTSWAIEAVPKQESSPCLMLPPEFETGTMNYKFYSLADDKVETLCLSDEILDYRLTCCRGSSHGWLALLGYDTFILYNPISRRHIKLPSILNLPRLPKQDEWNTNFCDVSKVILTCSPDEDEENCRVLIISTWGNVLALCCPGRSNEWTLMLDEKSSKKCDDCVYSPRLKLFFVLTNDCKLETWDLRDLSSPKLIKVDKCNYFNSLEKGLRYKCGSKEHLVVAGEDLLLVTQCIMDNVAPDGSCFTHLDERCPDNCCHLTIRFDIMKYDSNTGKFKYVDSSSLGGLAIFVGILSHSVAIPANEFPELKPDSIYFTNGYDIGSFDGDYSYYDGQLYGHDIGIYNYQDKTISPCYYPCDVRSLKTISPPPIWLFPN